jgi:hypothetical protein
VGAEAVLEPPVIGGGAGQRHGGRVHGTRRALRIRSRQRLVSVCFWAGLKGSESWGKELLKPGQVRNGQN